MSINRENDYFDEDDSSIDNTDFLDAIRRKILSGRHSELDMYNWETREERRRQEMENFNMENFLENYLNSLNNDNATEEPEKDDILELRKF